MSLSTVPSMEKLKAKLKDVQLKCSAKKIPPLLSRSFLKLDDAKPCDSLQKPTIRIMQWNILAQVLCQGEDNFVLCPPEALSWEVRKLRVVEEILSYTPDIVCLQEVDTYSYFLSQLQDVGYAGVFCPKLDSPCLYYENTNGPDGCAVFYRKDKLDLILSENINICPNGSPTNQVGILATFELSNTCNRFHVSVTHLKAKSGYEELRGKQAEYMVSHLLQKVGSAPLIFCGDFNGAPSEPLYKVISDSPLKLTSVYTLLNEEGREPEYTTWKVRGSRTSGMKESCSTIDYIWASRDQVAVRSLLRFPTGEDIGNKRLPSWTYPSDHLSLVADLTLL